MKSHGTTSWTVIASAFAVQIPGIAAAVPLFRLTFKPFWIPLLILLSGLLFAVSMHRRTRPFRPWRYWIPALLYAAFIFALSNQSFRDITTPCNSNYFHPIEFCFLGFFLGWAWHFTYRGGNRYLWAGLVLITGILYGAADEAHQALVPGRVPSLEDLGWDALGLLFGIGLLLILGPLVRSNRPAAETHNSPVQARSMRRQTRPLRPWLYWIPVLLYAAVIFALSSLPFLGARIPYNLDYFHPIEFCLLGFLLGWAWHLSHPGGNRYLRAGLLFTMGILYGAADEVHQAFVPGRVSSLGDLAWDALGLLLGIGLFFVFEHLLQSNRLAAEPENDPDHGMSIHP